MQKGKTVIKLPTVNYIKTHEFSARGIKHLAISLKEFILREIHTA